MIRLFLFVILVTFFICVFHLFVPSFWVEGSEKMLYIKSGTSGHQIIDRLKENHLIYKHFPYRFLYRWSLFHSGEYQFSSQMSPYFIFKKLSEGDIVLHKITFQEGLNMFEMAQILEEKKIMSAQEFLKVAQDKKLVQQLLGETKDSLEGYLYPDTYRLSKGISAEELVQNMVQEFFYQYGKISQSVSSGLSRHEIVILASLVEKETGASEERGLIASVFYNRIEKGMKFQSDPTILYGMFRKTGVFSNNIRKKDILDPTPYNTYVVQGFPQGPIGNPGRESLLAVLKPEQTDYLYFVSRNDGTHVFSTNLKDHNQAVNKYQRSLRKQNPN